MPRPPAAAHLQRLRSRLFESVMTAAPRRRVKNPYGGRQGQEATQFGQPDEKRSTSRSRSEIPARRKREGRRSSMGSCRDHGFSPVTSGSRSLRPQARTRPISEISAGALLRSGDRRGPWTVLRDAADRILARKRLKRANPDAPRYDGNATRALTLSEEMPAEHPHRECATIGSTGSHPCGRSPKQDVAEFRSTRP